MLSTQDVACSDLSGSAQPLVYCDTDGASCEVAELLGAELAADLLRVQEILPCEHCRQGVAAARALAGRRLGRLERRALLTAPAPDATSEAIDPERDGRAASEAQRRAVRSLKGAGLLRVRHKRIDTEVRGATGGVRRGRRAGRLHV